MNYTGKAHFSLTIVAPAHLEADWDRFFQRHAAWMAQTHYREGEKALLQYTVAKSADKEGNLIYVLSEVYESAAGIADHRAQGHADEHIHELRRLLSQCQVIGGQDAVIIRSLW